MQILVGADPEFFVKKNGVFVSAHGLIKGTKEDPLRVDRGAVQVDGHALEFNIDPAATDDEFYVNITTVMGILRGMCPEYEHAVVPVADFDADYLKSMPPESNELGCDPDYDAYTGRPNNKPDNTRPMRTASGHVHIGWTNDRMVGDPDHFEDCRLVTKEMDFYLGLPSLMYDSDTRRREMYGKAGCFRAKPYGAEYRTLSNAWLKSESLIRWVHRQVQIGMENVLSGNLLSEKFGDVSEIINNSDIKQANAIIDAAGIQICRG